MVGDNDSGVDGDSGGIVDVDEDKYLEVERCRDVFWKFVDFFILKIVFKDFAF